MKILVIGATGFMGSYLVPKLLEQGHSVRIFVRNKEKAVGLYKDSCDIRVGDITDADSLKGIFDDIEVVYNLAALMGHDAASEEAFKKFRRVNIDGLKNIIAECSKSNVQKFIHISSTAAMGLLKDEVIDEEHECAPVTPYQVTKREGELYLLNEYRTAGLPVMILRPSMVYGPGYKGDFLTIAKVCKMGCFPKIGMGKNLSPALYITDLADALVSAAMNGRLGEIYLISSRRSYSLKESTDVIATTLGKKVYYVYVPVWMAVLGAGALEILCTLIHRHAPITARNIKSTVTDRVFSIEKARKELDFAPKVDVDIGLKNAVNYFVKMKYL